MEDRHESPHEVIDAFVDGERVDAAALKDALADASGRDYLVDLWTMREAFQTDPAKEHKAVAPPVTSGGRRASWWLVAAAFATALVGGFAAGQNLGRGTPVSGAPVTGTVSTPVATAPATTPADGPFPVPVPTRVIQLEFRSTSASSGGN